MTVTEAEKSYEVAVPFGGYSVDKMKRAAFVDEINNCLILLQDDELKETLKEYLTKRIKEFDERYN